MQLSVDFDEVVLTKESEEPDPEASHVLKVRAQLINEAIEKLPIEFREVVILRELEELSYKEIASITGIPIGTVMSRLSRARKRLLVGLRSVGRVETVEKTSSHKPPAIKCRIELVQAGNN